MKSFLVTLVAVTAVSFGGLFTSSALAGGGHNHGGHNGHNHGHNHGGHHHSGHNHGGHHNHGSYYRPYNGGYGYGGYPYQYQQSGMYFRGSNFGIRIGF